MAGWAGAAAAHSPIKGIGHFYAGVLHPVVVPAHLMALLAAGLWLGQRPAAERQALLAVLAISVALGLALGALAPWPQAEQGVLAIAAGVATVGAAALALPRAATWSAAATLGLLLGIDSQPDGLSGRPLWLALAGSWLGALLATAAVLALAELARRPWMRIAQRVVASWVAAAAILALTLSWFGPAAPGAGRVAASSSAPR